jgi:cytochrome c peroxidase
MRTPIAMGTMAALLAALALTFTGIDSLADSGPAFQWRVPAWAPVPAVPEDNPMSAAKVELGRHLFYDRRLSRNETMSCATCHQQAKAFTDGLAAPIGVTGEKHTRGSMSLTNVGYLPALTWANPNVKTLEQQALMPMFGEHPVEMGMAGREQELFERLRRDARYPKMFAAAFPEVKGEVSLATITRAIGAFQRTLISLDAPYDRYRYGGEAEAISPAAKRGETLFFSEKFECYHCHAGFTFTDNVHHARLPFPEIGYHNNALYNVDGKGSYPKGDRGLIEFTGRPEDMGKFRTPTLRNVALTAPYMHDGSIDTLEGVVRHYARAGRDAHMGPKRDEDGKSAEAGKAADVAQPVDTPAGSANPYKSNLLAGFALTDQELNDMLAFLHSLTDDGFIANARHSDPFVTDRPARRPTGPR